MIHLKDYTSSLGNWFGTWRTPEGVNQAVIGGLLVASIYTPLPEFILTVVLPLGGVVLLATGLYRFGTRDIKK